MFEWGERNLDHLEKHGFTREDAEAVVTDPRRVRVDTYNARGERRHGVIGRGTGGESCTSFSCCITATSGPFTAVRRRPPRNGGTDGD